MITDDDRKLSITNNISRNSKEKVPNHRWKHNVSLIFYDEKYTKTFEDFMVDNKIKYFDESDESEVEVLPKPSSDVQFKNLENILNSMNAFLLLLVIYFMGS